MNAALEVAPLPFPTDLPTVAAFEAWQLEALVDGSFEFVRGQIIPKSMKQDEIEAGAFLQRKFFETEASRQGHLLMSEVDSYVDDFRKRIPDLTYFTPEQRQAIKQGERVSTLFAVEILSKSETHQAVLDKIQDYFDGGAQLVWYVVPTQRKIYAYTSPDEMRVFKATDRITAAPVVPDFAFAVADLFA